MPVDTTSMFAQVIQDHLALKERNSRLDAQMPLDRYKAADPFENHPLFKTEEQARLEETMDGEVVAHAHISWPAESGGDGAGGGEEDTLWGRSRDFDWGD